MNSPAGAVQGAVKPRVRLVPECVSSAGFEARDLAASVGLILDPWQESALVDMLGERADGRWSAIECGLVVGRQNGKSRILEARALASLFLFDAELTIWSAHQFKTAREAFRHVQAWVTEYDHLRRLVKSVRASHGEEGIELTNGNRLNFVARSRTSGRGFSGDCLILDEAQELDPEDVGAVLPMLSARPNPQIIYAGTVSGQAEHLRRVADRGRAAEDTRLCYLEWSADPASESSDRQAWADGNPALGSRLDPDFVEMELSSMDEELFRQERLSIWPVRAGDRSVFEDGAWLRCSDPESVLPDGFVFAVDAPPDRSEAFVAVAGRTGEITHVELAEAKRGLGWVADYLIDRCRRYSAPVAVDPRSALGSIIPRLEAAGIDVVLLNAADVAQACGQFFDAVVDVKLRHLDDPLLNLAVAGAGQRPLGDAWAWNKKSTTSNVSPLVAVTNAAWLLNRRPVSEPTIHFL